MHPKIRDKPEIEWMTFYLQLTPRRSEPAQMCVRALAIGAGLAIAAMSLAPAAYKPQWGTSGISEHFLAYAIAALLTRLAFPRLRIRYILLLCIMTSTVFELYQAWIHMRQGRPETWAADFSGALTAVILFESYLIR